MALYAFDGTMNKDKEDDNFDTNVRKFVEIIKRSANPGDTEPTLLDGVGTRFGFIGSVLGSITGAGGQERIEEMYAKVCKNYLNGDHDIDVIGFSRGAALAVYFCNVLKEEGIKDKDGNVVAEAPKVRFLGVWDIVGSFGIPINFIIPFQKINLGYDFSLPENAEHVYHAMSIHERRQTFRVTRLDPEHKHPQKAEELWFRGVHSDVGGGIGNTPLAFISLKWMLEKAAACGVTVDPNEIAKLDETINPFAPISENMDIIENKLRPILEGDRYHESAWGEELNVGEEKTFTVEAKELFSWSGIRMKKGQQFTFSFPPHEAWQDKSIPCGPQGWNPDDQEFNFIKEKLFQFAKDSKRHPTAQWFEVIGSVNENDDFLIRIGNGSKTNTPWTCTHDGGFFAFANDVKTAYGNNEGTMDVTVKRVA